MPHRELTYPCVVGPRIVELTAAQMQAEQWRRMPIEDKVDVLLQRIVALEKRNAQLEAQIAQRSAPSS